MLAERDCMKSFAQAGPLVIIGGAEDKQEHCGILREFVRLAGGPRARLVVLAIASEHPAEVGAEYLEVFHRLGVKQARVLDVRAREEANGPALVEAIEEGSGVFF